MRERGRGRERECVCKYVCVNVLDTCRQKTRHQSSQHFQGRG